MRKILVIGAGKSTSYLLDYLLGKAEEEKLEITIGDINPSAIPPSPAINTAQLLSLTYLTKRKEQMLLQMQTLLFQCYLHDFILK